MLFKTVQKQLLIALLLLTSLFLCACDKSITIAPLPQEAVILAFGDSLTFGTGAPAGQSYPDRLALLLNTTVINAGIPGEVSSAGLDRLPDLLYKHQPDLVIICHGGNDFLRRGRPELVEKNLRQMIKLSRAAGAEVLLISVPDFKLILATHPLYKRVAEDMGVVFDDEILKQLLSDNSLKSDQIHPNASGYRLLADAVSKLIDTP
jgi:lysophospholipase L1-like esterase